MKSISKIILLLSLLTAASTSADLKFLEDRKDQKGYAARQDLAYVEAAAPLSLSDRAGIKAEDLRNYSQEQLDQLYARLGSGPIPEGDYKSIVVIKNPLIYPAAGNALNKFTENGLIGFIAKVALAGICQEKDRFACLAEIVWSGKRFYKSNYASEVEVRNAVTTNLRLKPLLDLAGLGVLDKPLSKARVENFNGGDMLMLFPAQAYCGSSLYDARRESIVLDSAYGDDFTPFIPEVDGVLGRNGTWIRDEIRMIRPGLYLGRAYADRIFLLNFVLENKEVAARVGNDGKAKSSGFFDWLTGHAQPDVPAEVSWKNSCWEGNSWQ